MALNRHWRRWRSQPVALAAVVLTLGLSAGAAATVLDLSWRALVEPIAVVDTGRILRIESHERLRDATTDNTAPDVAAVSQQVPALRYVAAYLTTDYNLTTDATVAPITVTFAAADLWQVAGAAPLLGRVYTREHDRPGGDVRKTVLSFGLWQSAFGADRGVVGRTIRLGTAPYEVLGIMPQGFLFPDRADAWVPLEAWFSYLGTSSATVTRGARAYAAVARPGEASSPALVQDQLDRLSADLAREFPSTNTGVRLMAAPYVERLSSGSRPFLLIGSIAALALWVTGAAAWGALLGASRASRLRRSAIQTALGARRRDRARDAIAAGLPVGLCAAVAGLVLGILLDRLLVALVPDPQPLWLQPAMTAARVGLIAALALVPAIAIPLVLAVTHRTTSAADWLRVRSGPARAIGPRLLVAAQLALAASLGVAGASLLGTMTMLRGIDAGFDPDGAIAVFVSPPGDDFVPAERGAAYADFYDQVLEQIRQAPGTIAAGAVNALPLRQRSGWQRHSVTAAGQRPEEQVRNPVVNALRASSGYFEAMGIPLVAGRDFRDTDRRDTTRVVIVSRSLADRLWPDQDPLGRQVKLGTVASSSPWGTVIGVPGDLRSSALGRPADFDAYFSYRQVIAGEAHFVVRSRLDPAETLAGVGRAVRRVNPHAALFRQWTLTGLVDESLWQQRLWAAAVGGFAIAALLIAAVGAYGIVTAWVGARRSELAIRAALGAGPGRLMLRVVSEAAGIAVPATAGCAILVASARPLLESAAGTTAAVPAVSLAGAIPALAILVLAIIGPARSAARANPASALDVH